MIIFPFFVNNHNLKLYKGPSISIPHRLCDFGVYPCVLPPEKNPVTLKQNENLHHKATAYEQKLESEWRYKILPFLLQSD